MDKFVTEINNVYDGKPFDAERGLTFEEARVRAENGFGNAVKNTTSKSYLKIFADNLLSVFNLLGLLCLIALLSVNAHHLSNYAFVIIYFFNISIGIVQEIRAKLTVDRLSLVKSPKAVVVRDGKRLELNTSEIVCDDLIELMSGDQIPADSTLVSGCVDADESLLTGESVSIRKTIGDPLLSGSFIMSGKCLAKVERVGKNSYAQTLTDKAKKFKKTHSELLSSTTMIIRTIGILILPIAALTAFVQYKLPHTDAYHVVTATTSVIIGMIPAGMIFLLTLSLAVGIIKLARENTLVQDMYSLEMLARVDALCLDKTGTITDGRMTVYNCTVLNADYDVTAIIASMEAALGSVNQTSRALAEHFKSDVIYEPERTLAFSSERKYSAVKFAQGVFALGAPEYLAGSDDEHIGELISLHTSAGRRVLLLAVAGGIDGGGVSGEILPIALVALEDNVRPDAIKTINWFKENGVFVKVISGDDATTVSKIAERAGIDGADKYVSLYGLTDEEVAAAASRYNVFGRVSPEQKAVLIKALKADGRTVAMTGDGVNDILAMKEADCAISIASGSTAPKKLSHIVLLDDNFDSLPKVVAEGRRVINNIQQSSSLYLMKTIFTIVFALISVATFSPYPFSTGMLLPLEFFIIGLPSFFLSLQPNDSLVKGTFKKQVFANAAPSALILVLNVMLARYAYAFGLDTTGIAESLNVFALVFGGYVCLLIICLPLNNYRFCLISAIALLIVLLINFADFPAIFSFPPLRLMADWKAIVFLLILVLIDIPIFYAFDVLTKKLGIKVSLIDRKAKK